MIDRFNPISLVEIGRNTSQPAASGGARQHAGGREPVPRRPSNGAASHCAPRQLAGFVISLFSDFVVFETFINTFQRKTMAVPPATPAVTLNNYFFFNFKI